MNASAILGGALLLALPVTAYASPGQVRVASPGVPVMDDFAALELPSEAFGDPLAAAQHFARYSPETDEDTRAFELTSRASDRPDAYEMLIQAEGYADDSVSGEQWRLVVLRTPEGWRVAEAGVRYKCYRGGNAGQWQRSLCP